jgi:hypothetical protein
MSPNAVCVKARMRCKPRVEGLEGKRVRPLRRVKNRVGQSKGLERSTKEGDSPVGEDLPGSVPQVPKYHGTRETLWESGPTTGSG